MLSSRIYYVNSANRLSGTNAHFSYPLNIPQDGGFDHVVLLQANIPISYYVVQAGYNTFTLQEDDATITITMVPGNYNASSFASILTTKLNNASVKHWTYTVSFPNVFTEANTGKFTFTVSGNSVPPVFVFTNSLWEQMGFNKNTSYTWDAHSITSPNVINFMPESHIIIHSDIVGNQDNDILQEIFNNNAQPLSNAVYQCYDTLGYSKRLSTNQSNVYWFSITDEDNVELFLNGVHCIFTLLLYKKGVGGFGYALPPSLAIPKLTRSIAASNPVEDTVDTIDNSVLGTTTF